jgi:hypothetical protein
MRVPTFVHDARVDSFLPLALREERHLGGLSGCGFGSVLGGGADLRSEKLVAALAGLGVAAHVEGDAVDHGVEAFVVGSQRIKDLPHLP